MSRSTEHGKLRRTDTAFHPRLDLEIQEIDLPLEEGDQVNIRVLSFDNPPSHFSGKDIPVVVKIVTKIREKTAVDTFYLDGYGTLLAHVGSVEITGEVDKSDKSKVDRDTSKLRDYRDTIAGSPSINHAAVTRIDAALGL